MLSPWYLMSKYRARGQRDPRRRSTPNLWLFATGQARGVSSLTSTLDGSPAAMGQSIKFTDLPKGSRNFAVTALDNVGNTSTTNVAFTT